MAEQLPMGQRGLAPPPPARGPSATLGGIEAPPDLREWLRVFRRHIRLTVGVTAPAVAVAVFMAYTATSMYRATSVVRVVEARRVLAGNLAGERDIAPQSADPVLSQVEVLRSRGASSAVVDAVPVLRMQARGFAAAVLRDARVAPAVQGDVLALQFGERTVRVQRRSEEREVAYGSPIEIAGIGFTITERPKSRRGTLVVISREAATTLVMRGLLVKPRENTDVINISFTASDPERAQQIANS